MVCDWAARALRKRGLAAVLSTREVDDELDVIVLGDPRHANARAVRIAADRDLASCGEQAPARIEPVAQDFLTVLYLEIFSKYLDDLGIAVSGDARLLAHALYLDHVVGSKTGGRKDGGSEKQGWTEHEGSF